MESSGAAAPHCWPRTTAGPLATSFFRCLGSPDSIVAVNLLQPLHVRQGLKKSSSLSCPILNWLGPRIQWLPEEMAGRWTNAAQNCSPSVLLLFSLNQMGINMYVNSIFTWFMVLWKPSPGFPTSLWLEWHQLRLERKQEEKIKQHEGRARQPAPTCRIGSCEETLHAHLLRWTYPNPLVKQRLALGWGFQENRGSSW